MMRLASCYAIVASQQAQVHQDCGLWTQQSVWDQPALENGVCLASKKCDNRIQPCQLSVVRHLIAPDSKFPRWLTLLCPAWNGVWSKLCSTDVRLVELRSEAWLQWCWWWGKTWKGGKAKDQMPRTLRERERERDLAAGIPPVDWGFYLRWCVVSCRSRIAKRCLVSLSTEIYMYLQYIYVCLFIYIWYAYLYTSDTYGLTHADTCMCICSTACIQYTYPIHG